MKILRTITTGKPGTKTLLKKYGTNLISVRYRYDNQRHCKILTVELIEEIKPWHPNHKRIPKNKIMFLKITYDEIHLRRLVKDEGGRWNSERRLWEIPYSKVLELGLENRLIE